jgi:hypothetical protein
MFFFTVPVLTLSYPASSHLEVDLPINSMEAGSLESALLVGAIITHTLLPATKPARPILTVGAASDPAAAVVILTFTGLVVAKMSFL